ncbi:Protein of unknown function [Sporobacter termitidis DSM 10068]|uniref:DUF3793 family protein n=1 Tax=Sporobacter termitidis DSM 10068 TaxID=1123282 RepID=A0A1M5YYW2_9FIRM|nr:DUF3793 family protein [Sporobacter termitidis]SHI17064.1 Protein of unknown function [Sporobacter termitidis DSM 10068]
MLEDYLIKYCAPTLANLKPGSLFSYPCAEPGQIMPAVQKMNRELNGGGVFLEAVRFGKERSLIYVYRPALLGGCLLDPGTRDFLRHAGYAPGCPRDYIDALKARLIRLRPFPHEVGVFLGYPVADVAAFIDNKGQNGRLTGAWKVYHNEKQAAAVFTRYGECTALCARLYRNGLTLREIAASS